MASAAVASRAVFAVFLAIFLSRGRKKTVLIVPAKVSGKCLKRTSPIPLFRRTVSQKLRLIRIINEL
jgi:hypothetical protein